MKAYDKTNITSNLNPKESSTLIYDVNPGDSDNSPTCTFTKMIIFNNGFKPEVHCDDDVGLASFKSFFAYENDAQAQYEDIGNTKTTTISWSNNNKTITYNGVWRETNATGPWPSKGQCYYFRYGAMDTSGNYCTYVTQNCYSY